MLVTASANAAMTLALSASTSAAPAVRAHNGVGLNGIWENGTDYQGMNMQGTRAHGLRGAPAIGSAVLVNVELPR